MFFRNANTIKLKNFSHTWWNTQVREYSTSILERDKILRSLRKYERIEANTGGQGQGWLQICWSHYWKRGNIIKRMCWNRRVRLLCTLHLRFGYDIKNGRKFIQKLTPGLKNHKRNLDNFKQAKESPKSWNLTGYFCPKDTFLQLKHTEDLSNITFNFLCENLRNDLCHFWNHVSFFTTVLLYIFF